jgi:hypothetical protein
MESNGFGSSTHGDAWTNDRASIDRSRSIVRTTVDDETIRAGRGRTDAWDIHSFIHLNVETRASRDIHSFATFIHRVVNSRTPRSFVRATDDDGDVGDARDDDGDVEKARRARDEDEDDAGRDEETRRWDDRRRTIGTEGTRRRLVRKGA